MEYVENFIDKPQNNKELDICDELKKTIEVLILYRSLYILKKKFESGKDIIKKIYKSFNLDTSETVEKYSSYQVSINNFDIIAEAVFKKCNILIIVLTNPKDIFLSSLFLNLNKKKEEMSTIFKEIKEYIYNDKNSLVQKYNSLFYDKKIKVKIVKDIIEVKQINNENKIENELEKKEEDDVRIKEKIEENQEEEEIQRKIVEYNRKGKIIKTYSQTANDNLTMIIKKENENNDKIKHYRTKNKERYFKTNEMNENKYEGDNIIKEEKKENKEINVEKASENKNILINIENGQNYNNIIYIETLPLIIADYMQQFPFYYIIETDNDLAEELNILFDKELIEKMNNYEETLKMKNEKLVNKEYQSYVNRKNKIENNIKIYEDLINEKKLKGENTSYLEDMLEKLLANNIIVKNKISKLKSKNKNILNDESEYELNNIKEDLTKNINIENSNESNELLNFSKFDSRIMNTNNSKTITNKNRITFNNNYKNKTKLNDVRIKTIRKAKLDTNIKYEKSINLINKTKRDADTKIISSIKEIFTFYSKQHNLIGAKLLFSDLAKNMEHIGSSEFYKFCVEFNIPLTRLKSNDIFKKALTLSTSTYNKLRLMNFDEFLISLKLLAKEISKNKIELIRKNIEQEKMKLKEIELKQKKYKEQEKYNNSINLINKNQNNKNIFDKNEFYYQCEKKKFTNSIFNQENQYNNEINKNEEDIFNNFLMYLGINSKNEYRIRLKGFLLPFQMHEKKKSITKVKNGIGSRLESEIIEASKIFALQKEEKMKLSLSKEVMRKKNLFEEKKKLFKIKNEKLIKKLERKENRKYSDNLVELKNELNRRKLEKIEMKKKEEYEKKNIISWNRLENFDINSIEMNEIERICNNDDDNNSDEEIINKISEGNIINNNKKIPKNKSAFDLVPKINNIKFPPIINELNIENNRRNNSNYNSNFSDFEE